jgi:uncharacterized protein YabN with tetrapyrrole methylase and pyrophosphatase domain
VTGSLVVVGTGIGAAQLTTEARAELAGADEVFYLAADPLSEHAVVEVAPAAQSLGGSYEDGRSRREAYERMVEAILAPAREGKHVCAAFYGHPGMLVFPAREAITRARGEGLQARMLPGISALDCLFADLGVDPAEHGFQTYEAGDFLRRRPSVEPRAALVLWQVGVVGQEFHSPDGAPVALPALIDALLESYQPDHELVVYEASPYPGVEPHIVSIGLGALTASALSHRSTVYVPPLDPR